MKVRKTFAAALSAGVLAMSLTVPAFASVGNCNTSLGSCNGVDNGNSSISHTTTDTTIKTNTASAAGAIAGNDNTANNGTQAGAGAFVLGGTTAVGAKNGSQATGVGSNANAEDGGQATNSGSNLKNSQNVTVLALGKGNIATTTGNVVSNSENPSANQGSSVNEQSTTNSGATPNNAGANTLTVNNTQGGNTNVLGQATGNSNTSVSLNSSIGDAQANHGNANSGMLATDGGINATGGSAVATKGGDANSGVLATDGGIAGVNSNIATKGGTNNTNTTTGASSPINAASTGSDSSGAAVNTAPLTGNAFVGQPGDLNNGTITHTSTHVTTFSNTQTETCNGGTAITGSTANAGGC